MVFSGDLNTVNLADIFQNIAMNQRTGTLKVYDENSEKEVVFTSGEISVLSSGQRGRLPLGKMLVAKGLVQELDLQKILQEQKSKPNVKLGELLIEKGMVSKEDIDGIIKFQLEEELFDLFLWKNANFEFIEEEDKTQKEDEVIDSPRGQTRTFLKIQTQNLVMEACRRIDEWERLLTIVPSVKEVVYIADENKISEIDEEYHEKVKRLMGQIDGKRDVREIATSLCASLFGTAQMMAALISIGAVGCLPDEKILELGNEAFTEMNYTRALRRFRRLFEKNPENIEIQEKIPECYLQMDKRDEAARIYKGILKKYQEADQKQKVLSILDKLIQCVEDNYEYKLEQIKIYETLEENNKAIDIAEELVSSIQTKDQYPQGVELCQLLQKLDHNTLKYIRLEAKWNQDLGEIEKAGEGLYQYAMKILEAGKHFEAKDILNQAAALCPENKEFKKQLIAVKKMTKTTHRNKRAITAVFVGIILGVVIIGCGGYYLKYVYAPELIEKYEEVKVKTNELVQLKNYSEAKAQLVKFKNNNFLSSYLIKNLDADINEIDNAQLRSANIEKQKMKNIALEFANIQKELSEKKITYEKAIENVKESYEGVEDNDIVKKAEIMIAEIKNEIMKIEKEYDAALQLEKTGDLKNARKQYIEIRNKYPNSEISENIHLPVKIDVLPDGVEVFVDGKPVGKTPLDNFIRIPYNITTAKIELKKNGYDTMTLEVTPRLQDTISQILNRAVTVLWENQVGKQILASPKIFGQYAVAASTDGKVKVFDHIKGEIKTEVSVKSEKGLLDLISSPVISGDTLIVGGPDNVVHAFSMTDGSTKWTAKTKNAIITDLALNRVVDLSDSDHIFAADNSGEVYAIDVKDGKIKWSKKIGNGAITSINFLDEFMICGDVLGKVYQVLSSNGDPIWTNLVAESRIQFIEIAKHIVICGSESGHVVGYELSGKQLWSKRLDGNAIGCATASSLAFVSDTKGKVFAINVKNGDFFWKEPADLGAPATTSPIYSKSVVYIANNENKLVGFRVSDGDEVWTYKTENTVSTNMTIKDYVLIYATKDGKLRSLDAK